MTRWKKSPQKKEQEAVPTARDLINTDISKMSELEFRMMILKILAEKKIKILAGLEKSMEVIRETISGEIKTKI